MFASIKSCIYRSAVRGVIKLFALKGPESVYDVGTQMIAKSRLGYGRYPSLFHLDEAEMLNRDAGELFDSVGDYDEAMFNTGCEAYDNLSKRNRHLVMHDLLNYAYDALGSEGAVAECGCWRGQSTYMIASIMERRGKTPLLVFDSFEGLSAYEEEDMGELAPTPENEMARRKKFATDMDLVKDNLNRFDFVEFYKGWIPERFEEVSDQSYKFVHIDVDMYRPYVDSIEFFYPRLLKGGVLVFDDYGSSGFPGARKAVEELAEKYRPTIFLRNPLGGAFWVK